LTGGQGVIIPQTNVNDLTLNDDVVRAVEEGKFHIYAISHVDDGIELLTGLKAGVKDDKGKFGQNSIHGKVYRKLKEFYKKSIAKE
jgi:predicted ATP-dependent protease